MGSFCCFLIYLRFKEFWRTTTSVHLIYFLSFLLTHLFSEFFISANHLSLTFSRKNLTRKPGKDHGRTHKFEEWGIGITRRLVVMKLTQNVPYLEWNWTHDRASLGSTPFSLKLFEFKTITVLCCLSLHYHIHFVFLSLRFSCLWLQSSCNIVVARIHNWRITETLHRTLVIRLLLCLRWVSKPREIEEPLVMRCDTTTLSNINLRENYSNIHQSE